MSYSIGFVNPIWNDDYKNFEYTKQPISQDEVTRWRAEGYTHNSFTGEMYNSKNPMPDWVDNVAEQIGLQNCGYVFYRMKTNDVMPTHIDHFEKYCEIFEVERKDVVRCAIFLEDWKSGHYFEIGNQAVTNYSAGTYVTWSCEEPHFAANIGIEDRYTLQITGVSV